MPTAFIASGIAILVMSVRCGVNDDGIRAVMAMPLVSHRRRPFAVALEKRNVNTQLLRRVFYI